MAINSNPPVQLDPSQDQGHQIAFINQNFQSLANSLNPYILSDGTNNRLLIGKDSTGNYVVKVSKAGFDAFNAADTNLIFSSSQDAFVIVQSGTINTPAYSVPSVANQYTTAHASSSVAHNLGYIPAILAFIDVGGFYIQVPYTAIGGVGTTANWTVITASVDSTTVVIDVNAMCFNSSAVGTIFPIKYYLLQRTAN